MCHGVHVEFRGHLELVFSCQWGSNPGHEADVASTSLWRCGGVDVDSPVSCSQPQCL